MNYRVEEKKPFQMFGVERTFSAIGGQCYRDIPNFWLESLENKTLEEILMIASQKPSTTIGEVYGNDDMMINAAMYGHKEDGTLKYLLCAYSPEVEIPEGYVKLEVPALTWAIFPSVEHTMDRTTELTQEIWRRIYSEWFPTSGYEHADAPEFEMYYKLGEDQYRVEVWIPVIGKNA